MSEPMPVGPWAQEKLDCLRKYLSAYTTILKNQNRFKGYFYIDAFAGPGLLKIRAQEERNPAQQSLLDMAEYAVNDDEEASYLAGSPRIALEINHQFTDYVFVERDPVRIARLKNLKSEFSLQQARIHIREKDCNAYLRELLRDMSGQWSQWRGVVFLDPFGMQVPWDTITDLGATGAIEVLINFPVGMAIQRLLKRSGQFRPKEKAKLDEYFGTDEWFDLLYEYNPDLLGGQVTKVQESGDVLVRWYRKRLKEAFGYVTEAREIQSTTGRPLYYLIFAGPKKVGATIASDVLKQGARRVR